VYVRVVNSKKDARLGFENEKIDTPERIAELDRLGLVSPVTGKPPERWKWCVDRERHAFFVALGGGFGDIPEIFALVLAGGVVRIEGESDEQGVLCERNVEVDWRITRVQIPRSLEPRADEVLALIREAFTAYGVSFDSDPVRRVSIDLPTVTFV
jgi:hypothetical protein